MIDIAARDLSKAYRLDVKDPARPTFRLGGLLRRKELFWALKGANFDIRRGEAVGIVGANGSGKTTLVKLLSNVTAPTRGEITLRGRLASLIEVGAGFHPDLTGEENIYLNGAILGMSRTEISRKLRSIVEFSELNDFIGVPVKKYSSGMFVRLGFSIAAHLESEILLLDEVLAVGDIAFQTRCFDRIDQLRKEGRTVLLVSHDLSAIERICDRAMLLRSGEIILDSSPQAVVEAYEGDAFTSMPANTRANETSPITFEGVTFEGEKGRPAATGSPLICRLKFRAHAAIDQLNCTVSFIWPSGFLCTQMIASDLRIDPGLGEVEFECPILTMQRGLYTVDIAFERLGEVLDQRSRCALFRVGAGKIVAGDFYIEHRHHLRSCP